SERPVDRHRGMLDPNRKLSALRRRLPELTDPRLRRVRVDHDERARWLVVQRGQVSVAVNLGDEPVAMPVGRVRSILLATTPGVAIDAGGDSVRLPPRTAAVLRE